MSLVLTQTLYLKLDTLKQLVSVLEKKGESGINFTVFTNDEIKEFNGFGQNVSVIVSQTKEEQETGKKRFYVANGASRWWSGSDIPKVPYKRKEQSAGQMQQTWSIDPNQDDLPF